MESEKTSGGDKYSKLAGNTIIFAISSFSSKLLTLIVQPFLTYAMAEISDLGLSKILSQYANLLIPFVSMGMSNAIIRFGLDRGNSEKQVFTNGLLTILGGFGILVLCWPVAQFLPDMAQYGLLIYIYVLMSCLRTLCTQFVRSRQWNKLVAVDGVLCTVATMAFYVLYLVGFKWGANGYLLAIISGDLVSVLFLMLTGRLWDFIELKGINKTLWKQMLHFSLPMIPAQISFWIINASDLFFVREMCDGLDGHSGDAWSGLLSTGYFLPTILTTLGLIFYDAWQLSAVTEEEGRARFFTRIFRTYSSVLFCCAAGIIWLCRPVMHIMKSNYYYAWHFVPFLVLASTCSCFNQFMNSVYVVNKKSQRSMATMMAGAISNCLMNYFFIRWWGPVGATYASFLGLGLVFTLRAIDAHGMIGMHVHPGRVLVNAAALVFEAFVLLADTPLYGLWTGIITALIILYNFSGVWAMARILLPKILGRRGRALVAVVDGWAAKSKEEKQKTGLLHNSPVMFIRSVCSASPRCPQTPRLCSSPPAARGGRRGRISTRCSRHRRPGGSGWPAGLRRCARPQGRRHRRGREGAGPSAPRPERRGRTAAGCL